MSSLQMIKDHLTFHYFYVTDTKKKDFLLELNK